MTTRQSTPGQPGEAADALTSGPLLARNATWNLLCQGVPMAVAILTIPRLIRGLGVDRFGVLTLAWMVLGYFSLFDLGLGRALTKLVAERLGRGEEHEVPDLAWTGLVLMSALGLAGSLLVGLLAPWLVRGVLQIPGPLRGESLLAVQLLAVALPFVIGTAGLRGLMEAYQRFGPINAVKTVVGVFTLAGPLLVLPFRPSLGPVVGILVVGRVASWAAHVALCARTIPGIGRGSVRRDLVRPLVGFGGWMTLANVINPLMVQMDRFLIGASLGTAVIAYYTTPHELVTKSWLLSGAVLGVVYPAFATSYARERSRTALIFGRGLKYVFMMLFPPTIVLVALAPEILGLWLGPDFATRASWVMRCLAVGVFLNGLAMVSSALLQGVGRPDLVAKLHLVELPIYLMAAWKLIPAWGIEGAALAWTGRVVLDLGIFSAATRRVLPATSAPLGQMACALVLMAPIVGAAGWLPGLAARVGFLVLTLIAFGGLSWGVALGAEEREFLLSRLPARPRRIAKLGAQAAG